MTPPQPMESPLLRRCSGWLLLVGILALAPCLVGAFFSPQQFLRSYLPVYLFLLGIALGALALLMIYHLTGGAWGYLVRRILEAQIKTLPLLALLFLPIVAGAPQLYSWTRPEIADSMHEFQHSYLNLPYFWVRAAVYFACWLGLMLLLAIWSRQEDRAGGIRAAARSVSLSGPGLVIYGISLHFAAIDWIMSLDPHFKSTIFGPLIASGQLLSAHALTVLVFAWLLARPQAIAGYSLKAQTDLGSLLFTLLIVWAYMVWFQFMLIWIGNLPSGAAWYLAHSRGGWMWVARAIFVLQFAIPFFLLLLRGVKQRPAALACVAALIFVMQLVYMDYQVLPEFGATRLSAHWMDFLMPAGLGGIWGACFLWLLSLRPILPLHDRHEQHAVYLRHLDEEAAAREEEVLHA